MGFGASGRNGGQVGHGHNIDQRSLERKQGKSDARALWDIAQDSIKITRNLAKKHAPDAMFKPGHGAAYFSQKQADAGREDQEYLATNYGFEQSDFLDRAATAEIIGTDQYCGMVLEMNGGHLHPLNFALGRHPWNYHKPDALFCPHCTKHPERLGLFRPRGCFGDFSR